MLSLFSRFHQTGEAAEKELRFRSGSILFNAKFEFSPQSAHGSASQLPTPIQMPTTPPSLAPSGSHATSTPGVASSSMHSACRSEMTLLVFSKTVHAKDGISSEPPWNDPKLARRVWERHHGLGRQSAQTPRKRNPKVSRKLRTAYPVIPQRKIFSQQDRQR